MGHQENGHESSPADVYCRRLLEQVVADPTDPLYYKALYTLARDPLLALLGR